jgi:outer membrane protein assembly factor BamA
MTQPPHVSSVIRDNRPARGTVADYLREKIRPGADLSFVSAYFTIYAYYALKKELDAVSSLRFLFGAVTSTHGRHAGP